MTKQGKVVLVGAGPGDAGLLTQNAVKELTRADVVVYDRLVSESIMALVPPTAQRINVGKNVGNHPVPQSEINKILLNKALEGNYVVRLKGGDSFVFGRGGEELELLCENHIPFSVVPGITSALSAATYAGIPITHRNFCSSLHIITGHKKQDGVLDLDYASLVKLNGTLVFMMSVANCEEIANGLMHSGMESHMPCAVIENGTRPYQRKVVSTLCNLSADIQKNNIISPAVILVGKVCSLSSQFDWFSSLPLKGKKILVTRPKANSQKMIGALYELGADITSVPAVKTIAIDFALPDFAPYSWLVFTSAAGVNAFFDRLFAAKSDARILATAKIAAVGSETAKVLKTRGIIADFQPSVFCGKTLAEELIQTKNVTASDKLLLIRGKLASQELNQVLEKNSIPYQELAVYDTVDDSDDKINPNDFDCVTFTSASCVDAFAKHVLCKNFQGIKAVCIGEQTAAKARALGMDVYVSKRAAIDSMIDTIKEIFSND